MTASTTAAGVIFSAPPAELLTCTRCGRVCRWLHAFGYINGWVCWCGARYVTFEQEGTGMRAADGFARRVAA